jgi:hypothetical protein
VWARLTASKSISGLRLSGSTGWEATLKGKWLAGYQLVRVAATHNFTTTPKQDSDTASTINNNDNCTRCHLQTVALRDQLFNFLMIHGVT